MIKSIVKESIIILLLCVAILLILSILFYDYNPINKVIPNKIAYTTPENIRNELEEETIKNTLEVQNKIYTIEGSDLNIYKRSNTYDASKDNPFASISTEDANVANIISENNTQNNNSQKTNTINKEINNPSGLK